MMKTRHILGLFIPALLFVGFAVYIRAQQLSSESESQQTQQKEQTLIPLLPEDPILGQKKAPVTIIIFEDLACDSCHTQSALLEQLVAKYPDKVKVIPKLLGVNSFPYDSSKAHAIAFCANEQGKYAAFASLAFANWTNLSDSTLETLKINAGLDAKKLETCLSSGRASTYAKKTEYIARTVNIQSVPAVFINQKQIQPPNRLDVWESVIETL